MDNVLSVRDVALFLKINEQTVYRLARCGKIPARKIGKQWRFSRAEIEAMLRGLRVPEQEGSR